MTTRIDPKIIIIITAILERDVGIGVADGGIEELLLLGEVVDEVEPVSVNCECPVDGKEVECDCPVEGKEEVLVVDKW